MALDINKCTNANVYIDGTSHLGKCEEITLPDVSPKMAEHKALGMIGEFELPTVLQKMSAKFKWNAIYKNLMIQTFDFYRASRYMIRASIETWEGGSRTAQQPCVIYMTGTWKKNGGLVFKPGDNVETETELNVTAYKMEINNEEIIDIDVLTNVWRVYGVDQLAQFRVNLGI